MGYAHRAVSYSLLPTPDWVRALSDMNRHIELFPGHDPAAHHFRALVHDQLGNQAEAHRDRQLAR